MLARANHGTIRPLLHMGWLIAVLILPVAAQAQSPALDATDTAEIRQKALRHVQQFESLLNVISQSDEYFRKYSFDKLIRDYYRDASSYQIFRDSLVVIEDDLNPTATEQDYGNLLTIKDYLQAFFSLYEKSPPPSVVFKNYRVSPVQQNEFLYVEVAYESEFRSRHRSYPEVPYPVRQKRATVKAEPQNEGWRVVITDIGYARPGDDRPAVPLAVRPPAVGNAAALPPPADDENISTEALALADSTDTTTQRNSFTGTRRVYRSGKTYALPVQTDPVAPPSSLMLYRGTELVRDVSSSLADSTRVWQVPTALDQGKDYSFHLYDPASETVVKSPPFAIRRRARWPWVVGVLGAAAVVYAVISSGNDEGGGETEGEDELPPPPFPE